MKPKISERLNNPALTPDEWNKVFVEALAAYKNITWTMAELFGIGKKKFGKINLLKMTPLEMARVNWFCAVAECPTRKDELLPEHHFEVSGMSSREVKTWLQRAITHGWKPTELRKQIRKASAVYERPSAKDNFPSWPKQILMVSNRVKNLSGVEKEKALAMLAELQKRT